MKKSIKLFSLLLAFGLLTGCGVTPNSQPQSKSEVPGQISDNNSDSDEDNNSSESSEESQDASSDSEYDHEHVWDSNWSSDNEYHWHKCTKTIGGNSGGWGGWGGTPCDAIKDKAPHTWDQGKVTTPASAYSEGVKTYTCSVCKTTKTETIPATGGDEPIGSFSFNESKLNTAQEIHTTDQKNYLNSTTPYYSMKSAELNSYNALGTQEKSFPNQVTVSWTYNVPSGKTVSKYLFVYGQKEDLSDGYQITGTAESSISFHNPYLGKNHFKVIASLSDGSQEASEIKTFMVDEQAPRNLKIGNLSNCRDMGGRTTYAGGKVKQGLIFRTAQPSDNPGTEEKNTFLKQLKVKTEIYVKDGGGNGPSPLGNSVAYYNCSMDYGATPYSNLSRNAERLRKVFSILENENNYPLFYHCRIGTDRTGICAMAINGLLGVPFNECIQDYCFSNFGKIDGQRYTHKESDPNGDDPAKYIDEILAMPGKNFQEQTYNALLSIGISAQTLNKVINILTEGNKATLPSTAKVGKGSDLSSSVSKSSNSDYTHPEAYYALSSGKSVEYTANLTAGEKDIVVYLGSTDSSNSTKLANCIALKIDGAEKTITNSKTLYTAGFGITKGGRTGYMFNMLGLFDLTAGNHTITIAVKSGTFNIGTICVFDHVTA